LDSKYRCILADFGDAIYLPPGQISFVDQEFGTAHIESFCGTPYFMSPEMIQNWETCNGNDIWAFGVIMYQLLVGKLPFKGER
jgi:serine/threonine protein kinase